MRKTCVLLLSLSFVNILSAQNAFFERNYQQYFNNNLLEMRGEAGGALGLLQEDNTNPGQIRYGINHVNPDGSNQFFPLFVGYPQDFDFLAIQNSYIVISNVLDCDFWLPRTIKRFDFQGNLIWEVEVPANYQSEHSKLLPGADNSFWIFRDHEAPLHYDLDGNILAGITDVFPLFAGFIERSNGKLLTYGQSDLSQYNKTLSSIQKIHFNDDIIKADTLSGNRTVVICTQALYILDPSFEVIKVINHGLSPSAIADMATDGAQIHVLINNPNPVVYIYNVDLQLIELKNLPQNDPFLPKFMVITEDKLLLAGNGKPSGWLSNQQTIGVRVMPLNQPMYAATADALVTNIVIPAPPTVFWDPNTQFGSLYAKDIQVTVRNDGHAVLNSITLNSIIGAEETYCTDIQKTFKQVFPGINLMPGDSVTLSVGDVVNYFSGWAPTGYHVCFWTTLPNDSLDLNPLNDMVCKDFSVVVGTENITASVDRLIVSPNPTSGDFSIILPTVTKEVSVQLFDMTGRAVFQINGAGKDCTVHATGLMPGLYQLTVIDETGRRYLGKLIVE